MNPFKSLLFLPLLVPAARAQDIILAPYMDGFLASPDLVAARHSLGLGPESKPEFAGLSTPLKMAGDINENVFLGSDGSPDSVSGGNTTLGVHAGVKLTVGSSNTLIGYKAGMNIAGAGNPNLVGALNTFIGTEAGGNTTTGYANVYIGQKAGNTPTVASNNVFIGKSAGANGSGGANTFIGFGAGTNYAAAVNSVAIGGNSGMYHTGSNNTFVGHSAGTGTAGMSNGDFNTCIGNSAGYALTSGIGNTLVGRNTGGAMTSGGMNVIMGYRAAETLNDSLNIVLGTECMQYVTAGQGNILLGSYAGNNVGPSLNNTFMAGGDNGYSRITEAYFGKGKFSVKPMDVSIKATGGKGTNIPAAALNIDGGAGTGTGDAGKVNIRTAPAGASGMEQNGMRTGVQVDGNTTPGETPLLLLDLSTGEVKRVSIGEADSGGTGYKVLRVPN